MDACPNCGCRLAGDPSWCPRCLSRFDRVDRTAAAREFAAVWGAVKAPSPEPAPAPAEGVSRPPSIYTPYTPPPPPEPNPALPASDSHPGTAALPPARKTQIPLTVVGAILMGVVLQAVSYGLDKALHLQAPTAVALGLGLTVAFYLLVLSLVQGRLFYSGVKPVWHVGNPGTGAAVGVAVGGAVAFVVIAAASALAGHLASDDVASTVFAQGGLLRILALVTVMVVCAPIVEELLFRGLLAESLRHRGRGAAIWLSALAFALWHLRPDALRYYLLMGALLGVLYWKRGLVCSMAAHATFNGTLVVVAAVSLSGAPHTVTAGGVTLTTPPSWRAVTSTGATPFPTDSPDIELRSPSGAQVFIHQQEMPQISAAVLSSRLNTAPAIAPGVTIKAGTVRPVRYPAGEGAAADVDDNGHDAEAVVISTPQGGVVLELITAGNANARPQFESMLQSLKVD
jgi:membrane protease YdiL (CAAX protease family)